jgi:hypothetical protein
MKCLRDDYLVLRQVFNARQDGHDRISSNQRPCERLYRVVAALSLDTI